MLTPHITLNQSHPVSEYQSTPAEKILQNVVFLLKKKEKGGGGPIVQNERPTKPPRYFSAQTLPSTIFRFDTAIRVL